MAPAAILLSLTWLALAPVGIADLASTGACGVKVNEVLLSAMNGTTEQTTNEYVEIYNSCSTPIDIKGWSLDYRSVGNNSSGSNADIVLVADLNKTIAGGAYLLWAGVEYTGSKDGALANSLADAGGGVALVDGSGTLVDSVSYGPVVASHNFTEGTAAPLPPPAKSPGKSISRIPNGADTNENAIDFQVTDPTPKAQNM